MVTGRSPVVEYRSENMYDCLEGKVRRVNDPIPLQGRYSGLGPETWLVVIEQVMALPGLGLPPLDEYANPSELLADMLTQRQIRRTPSAADPGPTALGQPPVGASTTGSRGNREHVLGAAY
jgi:hypothetical protein